MPTASLTIRCTPPQPTASGSPISRPTRWSGTTTWSPRIAALPGVDYRSLGQTLDGQDDRLPDAWARASCKSGSTPASIPARRMAEWWMEGALERLTDEDDPVARVLRERVHLPRRPQHEPRRHRAAAICAPTPPA